MHDVEADVAHDTQAEPETEPETELDGDAGGDGDGEPGTPRHPLLIVVVIATLVAIGHGVWIWTHRRLGAFDPDETGYIATTFQYRNAFDLLHPDEFIRAVGGTGFGPLVPLLAVPLLWIGPDDPRTVMMIQPLLLIVAAVAVAGVTHRLASSRAAVVAGVTAAVIPTVTFAAQSHWFGLGAAASLAGAMWALLASDRCRTRTTWWFGVGLAAMLLSRTMALAFLPGALVAAAVVTRRDRPSLQRLAQSLGLTVLVAGPWWFVERETIFGYLGDYGYGDRAGLFGSGSPPERLWFRIQRIAEAIGDPVVYTALAVIAVTAAIALVTTRSRPTVTERNRSAVALACTVVLGVAALSSTLNNGVWFELPIVLLVVPLGVAGVAAAALPLRAVAIAPLAGMAIVQFGTGWWLLPPDVGGIPWLAENHVRGSQFEAGFAEYDLRFATDERGEERQAAREWWRLTTDVSQVVRDLEASGPVTFWVSGNMQLFNTNTLFLAAQLEGRTTFFHIPDTTFSADVRRGDLTPDGDPDGERPTERVLIVVLGDYIRFTPDREVEAFAQQARAAGWRITERFDMPAGGEVQVLRYPAP